MVGAVSIAMFVALVGWGGKYFGWSDPSGEIQLSLFASFVFGIICGYRTKS